MTEIDEEAGHELPEGAARCGIAALVGRPNVGKSTLLNALLGQKVSIVSPRPQTTRTRIHGVLTRPGMQIIFADLPGIHSKQPRAINRYMNRTALASLADSDVSLFVIEALRWTDEDERVLEELRAAKRPILLLINKVDRAHPKDRLLPFIAELSKKAEFATPLTSFKENITNAWKQRGGKKGGFLRAIDGRKIFARSEHALVNLMFQSAGSLTVKLATVFLDKWIKQLNLDAHQIVLMHDKLQLEVKEEHVEKVKELALKAFEQAGKYLNFNVPIIGEAKVGRNWAETH